MQNCLAHLRLPVTLGRNWRAGAEKACRVFSINARGTQQDTRWRFPIYAVHQQAPQLLRYVLASLHCRLGSTPKGRPKPPARLGGHAAVVRLNRRFCDGRRLSRCPSTASYANIAEVEYTSIPYTGLRLNYSFSTAILPPKVPGEKGGCGAVLHQRAHCPQWRTPEPGQ